MTTNTINLALQLNSIDSYTKKINFVIEKISRFLRGSECKILQFIIRKVDGFNKNIDFISVSQFHKNLKISANTIRTAINDLIHKGLVLSFLKDTGSPRRYFFRNTPVMQSILKLIESGKVTLEDFIKNENKFSKLISDYKKYYKGEQQKIRLLNVVQARTLYYKNLGVDIKKFLPDNCGEATQNLRYDPGFFTGIPPQFLRGNNTDFYNAVFLLSDYTDHESSKKTDLKSEPDNEKINDKKEIEMNQVQKIDFKSQDLPLEPELKKSRYYPPDYNGLSEEGKKIFNAIMDFSDNLPAEVEKFGTKQALNIAKYKAFSWTEDCIIKTKEKMQSEEVPRPAGLLYKMINDTEPVLGPENSPQSNQVTKEKKDLTDFYNIFLLPSNLKAPRWEYQRISVGLPIPKKNEEIVSYFLERYENLKGKPELNKPYFLELITKVKKTISFEDFSILINDFFMPGRSYGANQNKAGFLNFYKELS